MTKLLTSGLTVILLALMAGCATRQQGPEGPRPVDLAQIRDAELMDVVNWNITGRIGVRLPNDGFSAALDWTQDGEQYEISVFDPLGRTVAHLNGDWENARLVLNDGRVFEASDPAELMEKNIGWSLPVKSLIYWVRGLPDPHKVAWRREYDDNGQLMLLDQEGWKVTFDRYVESSRTEKAFPSLTRFAHKDFNVKLLIQEWN